MKKSWLDGGKIETIVAGAVLVAVLGLFAKFYRPAQDPTGPTVDLQTPAPAGPAQH